MNPTQLKKLIEHYEKQLDTEDFELLKDKLDEATVQLMLWNDLAELEKVDAEDKQDIPTNCDHLFTGNNCQCGWHVACQHCNFCPCDGHTVFGCQNKL